MRCHQYLKDTIWKQFTTSSGAHYFRSVVSPIPQRYNLKAIHNLLHLKGQQHLGVTNTSKIQSESNSQPCKPCLYISFWCHQYLKDTIWKQFTTVSSTHPLLSRCHQYLKDTIWKQFTTKSNSKLRKVRVSPIPQRYNLKAIHNLRSMYVCSILVSPIPQRYNLKAIHNIALLFRC